MLRTRMAAALIAASCFASSIIGFALGMVTTRTRIVAELTEERITEMYEAGAKLTQDISLDIKPER